MQLNRISDLPAAFICNRCMKWIEIVINLTRVARSSETHFISTVLNSLLLDRYHFSMCYDCYRFIQQVAIYYGFSIRNIDHLLCSSVIQTYLHAVKSSNQEDVANIPYAYRQCCFSLNSHIELDVLLTYFRYYVPFIPRPVNRSQFERLIIDDVVVNRRNRMLAPITMIQPNKSNKPNQIEKTVNNHNQKTNPCVFKTGSNTCFTSTTDLVPFAHPLRASLELEDTQSERMSVNSDYFYRYWSWSRQEMFHELRRSKAKTNIFLSNDFTKSEKFIPIFKRTRGYTTDLVHLEDTSEDSSQNIKQAFVGGIQDDSTANIHEFVDSALLPQNRIRDWIASSQRVQGETFSVDSYQSAAFIEQLQNTPTSSNSNTSLEITFQSDKIHEFDSKSTMDPVSEWLIQQPSKTWSNSTSTVDLNDRIMSYNNSPRSLSSIPLGQSEDEFLCKVREKIFPSIVNTDTHVTGEPLKRSRTMTVVRRGSPIPSTSTAYPKTDSDTFTDLSDSGITDSSDFIYVLGSVSSDIAQDEIEVKDTSSCSKDATTVIDDTSSDGSTPIIDESDSVDEI